jgi:integrase
MKAELENLTLVLSSPRPRAPTTLKTYLSTAKDFLTWLGKRVPPTETDLRKYFIKRRADGLSEATLATVFNRLKKLYQANHWPWPMVKEDRPESNEPENTPVFTPEEVEQLIAHRSLYTKAECFYLAIATTFIVRRIELARIQKRDIKDQTIRIQTAKKGKALTHLIPPEIASFLQDYHPKQHEESSLTRMFQHICKKGLGKHRPGYGWHTLRRTVPTVLIQAMARAGKDVALVGRYAGWSRARIGTAFLGAAMAGVYSHPEKTTDDPYFVDHEIFEIHPFLPLWRKPAASHKSVTQPKRNIPKASGRKLSAQLMPSGRSSRHG